MPIFGAGWIARKAGRAQRGRHGSVACRSGFHRPGAKKSGEKSGEKIRTRCAKLNIGGETGVINFDQRREPPSRRSDGPGSPSAELGSFCLDTREGRSGYANERGRRMRAAYRSLDTRYFEFGRNDSSWRFLVLQQSEIDLRKPSHRPVDILPQCPAEGLKRPQMPPH
jgi:hypothetical protein